MQSRDENHEAWRLKVAAKALQGIIDQGGPSLDNHSVIECAYRVTLPDGRECKCGIGHLIPDSEYQKSLENHRAVHVLSTLDLVVEGVAYEEYKLRGDLEYLGILQRIHDSAVERSVIHAARFWEQLSRNATVALEDYLSKESLQTLVSMIPSHDTPVTTVKINALGQIVPWLS